jgi:hypothetical protein
MQESGKYGRGRLIAAWVEGKAITVLMCEYDGGI